MSSKAYTIRVLIASYNRKNMTLSSLQSLYNSASECGVSLDVILGDSSSTDGTQLAVEAQFPGVKVLNLEENSFWAQSMRSAWLSSKDQNFDYLLWLNDDVQLHANSIRSLIETSQSAFDVKVVVGSTSDPETGGPTYGGYQKGSKWSFLHLEQVTPGNQPKPVDLANGNILLIPKQIVDEVEGFPEGFSHSMADLFFSSQVVEKGFGLLLAPGYIGSCRANAIDGTWQDSRLTRRERFKLIREPKGLPFREWSRLCLRLGGFPSVRYVLSPFVRILIGR